MLFEIQLMRVCIRLLQIYPSYWKEQVFYFPSREPDTSELDANNAADQLKMSKIPFPFRVAKSLDPNIYRNIEYDTWHTEKKGS